MPVGNLDEPVELPEPLTIPYIRYAGDWVVAAMSPVLCSNGLTLIGGAASETITLNASAEGLVWGPNLFTTEDGSVFTYSTNNADGSVWFIRFEFNDAGNGTYTYTFDPQGAPNYGCNEAGSSSAAMTRP